MSSGSESSGSDSHDIYHKKDKKDKKDKDKKSEKKGDKKDKDKKDKDKKDGKESKDKSKEKDGHKDKKDSKDKAGKSGTTTTIKSDKPMEHGYPSGPSGGGGAANEFFGGSFPTPGQPQSNFDASRQLPVQTHPNVSSHAAPPSGFRIPLDTNTHFAQPHEVGPPPAFEGDNVTPVYFGSAIFPNSVQPCKVGAHLQPNALVPYASVEHPHTGRYDLLPFVPSTMELVWTSHGRVPAGRRPVEGGYEENGDKLYHALANINGQRVPGKTGEHLGAAHVGYGGQELAIADGYEILCWR